MTGEQHRDPPCAESYALEKILKEVSDIVSLLEDAQKVMDELVRLTTQLYGSVEDLAVEHERLIEALRERRTEDAVALMRSHILHGHDQLLAELSSSRASMR